MFVHCILKSNYLHFLTLLFVKKTQIILAALVVFAAAAFTVSDNSKLVKINHKGAVIEVAPQAVPAHLSHGDTVFGNNGSSAGSQAF
ncbi:hypothetical protein SAMN05421813_104205 [Daejeonella rubra]|uniref:Uncharacterized protein n=1 Tax=Daejeonella rubra TaxID=990371 RepID=A0A1G9PN60_9SPHI|nr:hypothetical protein SAMN05421813_104205 [Daejeonella rubra]